MRQGNGAADLRVQIEPGFDFMSSEYGDLYHGGQTSRTVFQAPLWMAMQHDHLGRALGAKQRTVTVRRQSDARLVGVLPFVVQRSRGVSIIQPADFGVSDYNGIVTDPQTFASLAADESLRRGLRASLKGVDLLMFRKRRHDALDIDRLFDGMKRSLGENAAYACHLGDDFEVWRLRVLSHGLSKDLGRLQRQTERQYGTYVHHPVFEESEIRKAFDFLREMHRERHDGSLLDRAEYFDFYRDYAVAAARTGEAIVYVSYLDGVPIAVLFGLTGDGDFHATLIGADTVRYPKTSSGMQIIYRVIEQRHREGHRIFDMCLGDPGYKQQFRPVVTDVHNSTLSLSLKGAAVAAIYHHAKPLKNILRRRVSNVR